MGSQIQTETYGGEQMRHVLIVAIAAILAGCHHLAVEADTSEGLLEPHVHIDLD